jgi:type VI secretion system secreted protein VgrG
MQSIELKVGASSIKLEPAKITIKSPQIAIQADATLDAKSPMTTINGDATLTLKGGMIMIN